MGGLFLEEASSSTFLSSRLPKLPVSPQQRQLAWQQYSAEWFNFDTCSVHSTYILLYIINFYKGRICYGVTIIFYEWQSYWNSVSTDNKNSNVTVKCFALINAHLLSLVILFSLFAGNRGIYFQILIKFYSEGFITFFQNTVIQEHRKSTSLWAQCIIRLCLKYLSAVAVKIHNLINLH